MISDFFALRTRFFSHTAVNILYHTGCHLHFPELSEQQADFLNEQEELLIRTITAASKQSEKNVMKENQKTCLF